NSVTTAQLLGKENELVIYDNSANSVPWSICIGNSTKNVLAVVATLGCAEQGLSWNGIQLSKTYINWNFVNFNSSCVSKCGLNRLSTCITRGPCIDGYVIQLSCSQ
ncbi:hypothetical protein Ciccas_010220, partial [Cichlidogyrus casuarinus]